MRCALLRWVRRFTRFCLALLLWLNALLLLRITLPSFSPLATRLHLSVGETTILFLLAAFSVLSSYGWKNITVDLLYLYFFPFIFLYLLIRAGFWAMDLAFKVFSRPETALVRSPTPLTIDGQISETPQPQTPQLPGATGAQKTQQYSWRKLLRHWFRPFLQFTLLWCLLLLLSSHRWLLWTALIIVLAHLARTLVMVVVLAVFSVKGLSQLEDRIKTYAEGLVAKILGLPEQLEPTEDLRQAWLSITGLQIAIGLLKNRHRAAQWLVFFAALAFVAIYFYVAFLFAFGYYGLARIQSIPYTWAEALVTAIFIPVASTDLPHNPWVKLLGGIHWSFVVLIGVGTIFGYLQRKLDSLYKVAEFLNSRFQEDEVKKRISTLNEKFKVVTVPGVAKPSQ